MEDAKRQSAKMVKVSPRFGENGLSENGSVVKGDGSETLQIVIDSSADYFHH